MNVFCKKFPILSFFLTLLLFLSLSVLFPKLRLSFFAPFIVACYYHKYYVSCLWISIFCGLCIDFISFQSLFGIYSLNYCFTTYFVYQKKKYFFENNITNIPVLTGIFSLTSSCLQAIFLYILGFHFSLSFAWVFTELICMTVFDSAYAFLFFTLPFILLKMQTKKTKTFTLKRPQ